MMGVAMDIYVGKIVGGFSDRNRKATAEILKEKRNRRKTHADRRESVRSGVIVSLFSQDDQRTGKDRRSVADHPDTEKK